MSPNPLSRDWRLLEEKKETLRCHPCDQQEGAGRHTNTMSELGPQKACCPAIRDGVQAISSLKVPHFDLVYITRKKKCNRLR